MPREILPEGRLLSSAANRMACSSLSALRGAMEREEVLEGVALLSHADKGLEVAVGPFLGYIPPGETALGLAEGRVREIAVLARVGKPICFTITGIEGTDGGIKLILSRRRAQELAWAGLRELPLGTVIPATVNHLEPFGAFVDMGRGLPSMIGVERISVSRIRHPGERFQPGQEIWAAILGRDDALCRLRLTHKELLGTWEENARRFDAGMTVPGTVRGVMDYGLFVELLPNLTGLAEPHGGIREGDRVSVYLKALYQNSAKCKLLIINKLPPAPAAPLRYFLPQGMHMERWHYLPESWRKPGHETVFLEEE